MASGVCSVLVSVAVLTQTLPVMRPLAALSVHQASQGAPVN